MTVTETQPAANSPTETDSRWTNPRPSCWFTQTRYAEGRLYQNSGPCRNLGCPECGPILREQAWEEAVVRHALEPEIWVLYVRADQVDKWRKRIERRGRPGEKIPVSKNWDAFISTHRFEGAVQLSLEEKRRLFITHRTTRRQHRKYGRWESKKKLHENKKRVKGVTLSRFISHQAVDDLAKALGVRVKGDENCRYIEDKWGLGAEWFKKVLVEHEHHLRKRRQAVYSPSLAT